MESPFGGQFLPYSASAFSMTTCKPIDVYIFSRFMDQFHGIHDKIQLHSGKTNHSSSDCKRNQQYIYVISDFPLQLKKENFECLKPCAEYSIQKHCYILDLKLCLPSLYFVYSDHIKRWLPIPNVTESSVFNSSVCGFVINMVKFEASQLLHIWIYCTWPKWVRGSCNKSYLSCNEQILIERETYSLLCIDIWGLRKPYFDIPWHIHQIVFPTQNTQSAFAFSNWMSIKAQMGHKGHIFWKDDLTVERNHVFDLDQRLYQSTLIFLSCITIFTSNWDPADI